jgi:hypothetical protein
MIDQHVNRFLNEFRSNSLDDPAAKLRQSPAGGYQQRAVTLIGETVDGSQMQFLKCFISSQMSVTKKGDAPNHKTDPQAPIGRTHQRPDIRGWQQVI